MTIIAAAARDGEAWIGCDRQGTDGWGLAGSYGSKLFAFPFGVVGFTGSYRTLQAIRAELWKVREVEDDEKAVALVGVIDRALQSAGWARSKADGLPECEDLTLLIATPGGRIWRVSSDLSILTPELGFAAVGSGYQVASGAMHALSAEVSAEGLVRAGLEAATDLVATCGGELTVCRVTREELP